MYSHAHDFAYADAWCVTHVFFLGGGCGLLCICVCRVCRRERNWETSRKSEKGKDGDGNPLILGPYPQTSGETVGVSPWPSSFRQLKLGSQGDWVSGDSPEREGEREARSYSARRSSVGWTGVDR